MHPTITAAPLSGGILGSVDNSFAIAEWRDAGGPPGPPRLIAPPHVHYQDDEAWYVLEGVLHVRAGERIIEVRAGSGAFVPRGTLHTYWNPGAEPARYLLIMTPNILRLIQAIHAAQDRSPAALRALFRKYDSDLAD